VGALATLSGAPGVLSKLLRRIGSPIAHCSGSLTGLPGLFRTFRLVRLPLQVDCLNFAVNGFSDVAGAQTGPLFVAVSAPHTDEGLNENVLVLSVVGGCCIQQE
jgi:hypothetical protein